MSGFTDQDGFRADDDEDLRAEALRERRAARRYCITCHHTGGHASGCPEAEDDETEQGED